MSEVVSGAVRDARYPGSARLAQRAAAVMPGGHHLSGRPLLDGHPPLYLERAAGCQVWDVDGRAYIDYVMAYGAVVLGYAHEEVDAAAIAQLRRGSLVSLNHRMHVEFLEALLPRFPGAERGVFVKTGSEATTAALRIARHATGRRAVMRAGYHGWHDWCLPHADGVPAGLGEQVTEFAAGDPDELGRMLAARPGEVAAVIVAPEMVAPLDRDVFEALFAHARRAGAMVVLDEIKTGVRALGGSVQQQLGLAPDLTTVSKALGNGWPIAAVIGPEAAMRSAAGLHLSATYHGDTASMAAALTTLAIAERDGVAAHLERMGARLIAGLNAGAARHGIAASAYGEPMAAMPFLRFSEALCASAFYEQVLADGVLLHPRHLWFISQAHGVAEIDHTLEVCERGFEAAARGDGAGSAGRCGASVRP